MRARWRRNTPSAASRGAAPPASRRARPARRQVAAVGVSGRLGRGAGVNIRWIGTTSRLRRGNRQQRLQTIQCLQRLARRHRVGSNAAKRLVHRIGSLPVALLRGGCAGEQRQRASGRRPRSVPPCFSSAASSAAARRTTGAGTPASRATCTPQLRPAAPSAHLVQEHHPALPFLHPHRVRPQPRQRVGQFAQVRGNAWRRWCGSGSR